MYVEFERPRPSHQQDAGAIQPVLEAVYLALKKKHERRRLCLYEERSDVREVVRQPSPLVISEPGVVLQSLELPDSGRYQIVVTEVRRLFRKEWFY